MNIQQDRVKGIYNDSWTHRVIASKDDEIKALRELVFKLQKERDQALKSLRDVKERYFQGGSIK
jgi:hypothetical protein